MDTVKAYMSQPIRGRTGNNATDDEMKQNNSNAIAAATILEANCPNLSLYVPGRLDGFLTKQGVRPLNIVDDLLSMDCAIVRQSDLLLVYMPDNYISNGMLVEINEAVSNHVPVFYFIDTSNTTIGRINNVIGNILKGTY